MSDEQGEMFKVTKAKRPTSMSSDESPPPTGDSYVPAPPSGPAADPYHHFDSRPEKFVKFFLSKEGQGLFAQLRSAALDALRSGEKRFSVRAWVDSDAHKKRVNNSFCPWLADELVIDRPELLDIIERRVRKRQGPRS